MSLRIPPTYIKHCNGFRNGDFYRFIKKYRPEHLPHYDDLYLLMVSQTETPEEWRPFMTDEQYETFIDEKKFVIAYAHIEKLDDGCAMVHWLETRIPGHGFGTYLRRRLRSTFGDVLPSVITKASAGYWNEELGFKYAHEDGYTLDEYMKEMCGYLKHHFNWNALKPI